MEISGTVFNQVYPLLVLSVFNTVLLFVVLAAIIAVTAALYKSGTAVYRNKIDALLLQVTDMQQHLDYASREETKARADARRAAAARDKLLVSLNHEIRTPMNGILGMASLLEETSLGAEQKDYIDTIIGSGRILLNKVDEIISNDELEQSKINRTINAVQQKNTDILNCVEEVAETFAARAAARETDLLYRIDEDVPLQVLTDTKRLQQVLTNLVENVMENKRPPQVVIGVHIFRHNRTDIAPALGFTVGGNAAEDAVKAAAWLTEGAAVKDTGSADDEKTLGLTICNKLLEEMGGQLRTGGGAIHFVCTIPLQTATAKKQHDTAYSIKDFEGKRVLVVNRNPVAANMLKKQLKQWKMIAETAGSSEEALALLNSHSHHIIITEMNLPGNDGISLVQTIKTIKPELPLLLLSPLNDKRIKQYRDIDSSITVLNKPLKRHILFDSILNSLRQNKKAGQAQDMSVKKLSHEFAAQYPLRILVAEDNDVNQKWTLKILSKMGYQADIAANGHIALDMVDKTVYDLILMDVQMPEMDGLEATRMIRVCLNKQPVIIAMTANALHGDRMECMQAGMDDYISKPVQLGELVNLLEKWALVITEKKMEEREAVKNS